MTRHARATGCALGLRRLLGAGDGAGEAEMRREAAFPWRTPFELAFPSVRSAAASAAVAAAASPFSSASRTRFTALFTPVRTWTLRVRRFRACRLRFSADRVFAKLYLSPVVRRALITARGEGRQGVMAHVRPAVPWG